MCCFVQMIHWQNAHEQKEVDWDSLFEGYEAMTDLPGCVFYKELMEKYPEAKVILTVRDPETWYESAYHTIHQPAGVGQKIGMMVKALFSKRYKKLLRLVMMLMKTVWWKNGFFQGKFKDKATAIRLFNEHNEAVKRDVPAEKLLVFSVKEGWEPLCTFLEVPVPDTPFPKVNERAGFQELMKKMVQGEEVA